MPTSHVSTVDQKTTMPVTVLNRRITSTPLLQMTMSTMMNLGVRNPPVWGQFFELRLEKYLQNIVTVDNKIMVHCNAETSSMNKKRMISKFPVWYNSDRVATVLSLKTMTKNYKVTYDSDYRGGVFVVHTPNN